MTTLELIFVVALALKSGAELLLEKLNRGQVIQFSDKAPEGLNGIMDDETYAKSNLYTLAKSRFGSIELLFDAVILAVVILSGLLPALFSWW
ncbi:MAG: M48 family peptidase, partial [Opitutales bacterium]|nr:M48 family peptidase [Opitutales bacterium]